MSTPQAKRRRLEAAKTLHKPFKSPFHTPLKPGTPSSDPPSSDPPEASALDSAPPSTIAHAPSSIALKSAASRPRLSTPARPAPKKSSPSLTREIMQLRSDIQILTQAHSLATSTKDEDLRRMIDTWRTASRAAADDLFVMTRNRVDRMGGVAAWRERERQQQERKKQWDREEMEVERQRVRSGDGDETECREYDEYGDERDDEHEHEDQVVTGDDTFTMDMMLKTLNIDPKLIGYNKETQRWDG